MNGCVWNSISQYECYLLYVITLCYQLACHPIQVNTPRFNLIQTGQYSIYMPRTDGRLS